MDLTSDDILGKEAVDPEGEILGVVMKLHLDKKAKSILGITIDSGMWKPDLFVGIDFVDTFGIDAIFLNRVPVSKYKGLKIFTYDGSYVGKVTDTLLVSGELESLEVSIADKDSRSPFKKKKISILRKDISEISYSVILKKGIQIPNLL